MRPGPVGDQERPFGEGTASASASVNPKIEGVMGTGEAWHHVVFSSLHEESCGRGSLAALQT